jgi:hypothetical protein
MPKPDGVSNLWRRPAKDWAANRLRRQAQNKKDSIARGECHLIIIKDWLEN